MKRITNFFNGSETKLPRHNAPPTPPLAAEPPSATTANGFLAVDTRPRTPGSYNMSSVGSRHTMASTLAPSEYAESLLTPSSTGGMPLPPPSPLMRPGTAGSRPGTSSGLSAALPVGEPPKLRKTRDGRFGKRQVGQITWKLAAGTADVDVEQYEAGPLLRGEPAKELWNEDGDTLVYFSAKDSKNTKYAKPVFRIHSSQTMFQCLGPYIVDVEQPVERRGSQSAPSELALNMSDSTGSLGLDVAAVTGAGTSETAESAEGADSAESAAESPVAAAEDGKTEQLDVPESSSTSGSRTSEEQRPRTREGSASRCTISPGINPRPQEAVVADETEIGINYKIYWPVADEDNSRPTSPSNVPKSKKLKKPKHTKADAAGSLQRFIDARNVFAFLSLTYLVASQTKDQPFDILSKIHLQLGLGEADQNPGDLNAVSKVTSAEIHLQHYINELRLDDVRNDDNAIVEALILGEKWRSHRLYHEGFIHAVGRWVEIWDHAGFSMVSQTTKNRLERASHYLHNIRLANIKERIPDFEFPSVWVGEGRYPDFKSWRQGYDRMRTTVMNHAKHVFGSWPPRAEKTGKGGGYTETGGLNRVALKRIYDDLCCVYDLTVDREWLRGERIHFEFQGGPEAGSAADAQAEKARTSLRKILAEFDKSSVPIQPEMPFDLPRIPFRDPAAAKKKKTSFFGRSDKKIRADEIQNVLNNSYNQDSLQQHGENALVKSFIEMEREFGTSKQIDELIGARRGAWVFMYCVLQTLVMGVVDAQGLAYGEGVEYFLCENVKGIPPWEKGSNRRQTRMTGLWLPGPNGMISAMSSTANLGLGNDDEIEMTYRNSHCWLVSEAWRLVSAELGEHSYYEGSNGEEDAPFQEYQPGLQVPNSPKLGAASSTSASDRASPTDEMQRLNLDGAADDQKSQRNNSVDRRSTPSLSQHPAFRHTGDTPSPTTPIDPYSLGMRHPAYHPAPHHDIDSPISPGDTPVSPFTLTPLQTQGFNSDRPNAPQRKSSLPAGPGTPVLSPQRNVATLPRGVRG